jgi:hypothetical protein
MCTLLTLDRATYLANEPAMRILINQNHRGNYHGWSLYLSSQIPAECRLFSGMDEPDSFILDSLQDLEWDRLFLHQRYATSSNINIANNHHFSGGNYIIMHNGMLTLPTNHQHYSVDSKYIADKMERMYGKDSRKIDFFLNNLALKEYANLMLIETQEQIEGAYIIVRSAIGKLYTDNKGNYSTASNPLFPIRATVGVHHHTSWEPIEFIEDTFMDNIMGTYYDYLPPKYLPNRGDK